MNNEFTYYKVEWLQGDLRGFYKVTTKTLYSKQEALEYKELVDRAIGTKNCIVKKIIEKTEVIA